MSNIQYAFPSNIISPETPKGMTLRDYFAAHSDKHAYIFMEEMPKGLLEDSAAFHEWRKKEWVKGAYRYADAMLKERSK